MPTPMKVYFEIARICGVDSNDEAAVEHFFQEELLSKSEAFRLSVFELLMQGSGESIENIAWEKLLVIKISHQEDYQLTDSTGTNSLKNYKLPLSEVLFNKEEKIINDDRNENKKFFDFLEVKKIDYDLKKMEINSELGKILQTESNVVVSIIKVKEDNYVPQGVNVRSRISKRIFTGNFPSESLQKIQADPCVISISLPKKLWVGQH